MYLILEHGPELMGKKYLFSRLSACLQFRQFLCKMSCTSLHSHMNINVLWLYLLGLGIIINQSTDSRWASIINEEGIWLSSLQAICLQDFRPFHHTKSSMATWMMDGIKWFCSLDIKTGIISAATTLLDTRVRPTISSSLAYLGMLSGASTVKVLVDLCLLRTELQQWIWCKC